MSTVAATRSSPRRRSWRPAWLTIRMLRLASGLVLFAYVASHLVNHALGNISLDAMGVGLGWLGPFWQSWLAATLLYGSLAIHMALGLHALYARPRLAWGPVDMAQTALGIALVPLLAQHVVGTKLAYTLFGQVAGYGQILAYLAVVSPGSGGLQALALVITWLHGCLGLHGWLRLKPGFDKAAPILLVLATLLPALSLIGYAQGERAVGQLAADPAWRATNIPAEGDGPGAREVVQATATLDRISLAIVVGSLLLVFLVLAARVGRYLLGGRRGVVRLTYPNGAVARVPRGTTVLEASRLAGIPHASVCGGRGRCSTCRIRVMGVTIEPPGAAERTVLDRVGAGADVRLACQFRPRRDLLVVPLLSPRTDAASLRQGPEHHAAGEERAVVAMFVDMRGSTRLAEHRLPYDTVFVINRFLEAVGRAVQESGGSPNQILGDGMMALFGIDEPIEDASRHAIASLGRIAAEVATLNRLLATHLDEPIRFGIGLHAGTAILGEIGDREHGRAVFTAIGDPVNVASRLQGLTKGYGVEAVVSDAVFEAAGLRTDLPSEETAIEGRSGRLGIRLAALAAEAAPPEAASAPA